MSNFQYILSEAAIQAEMPVFADDEGAQCQFLGTVRHLEDGRLIAGIDYSVYLPMAEKELHKLCEEGQTQQPAHQVYIQHRLGFVAAREPSIVIRVNTKHSAESFSICQWYLKAIKTSVPIWKKPIWADSAS